MSEFAKQLEIDLHHLDDAWLDLPKLSEEWNSKTVEAELEYLTAKQELEDKISYLDQNIREFPGDYGISKITEGVVKAEINAHPDVVNLTETTFKYMKNHKRLRSKCGSIAVLEKSLNGLSKLYESGYFVNKPICASVSKMAQERETEKLNTPENKKRMIKAKTK